MSELPRLLVVMGVSGSGKTIIGIKLAQHLEVEFIDGDDLHPPENIKKMSAGKPLNDEDRWPWFRLITKAMLSSADEHGLVVVACSALKRSYRDFLRNQTREPILFIHLNGPKKLIAARQAKRTGHFMPERLLDSQFAALELPENDENTVSIPVDQQIDSVLSAVLRKLLID